MKRSLDADYFDPLVVNERNGLLVSGHLRLKMMIELGFSEVDVVLVAYDDATHKARMIAANTLLGEFEETVLRSLATDINIAGLDAALAGLTQKRLLALLEPPKIDDDSEHADALITEADKLQEKWKVSPGDLWDIGGHRLFCGDSQSEANWLRLLGDRIADLTCTDPPYNVAYDACPHLHIATLGLSTANAEQLAGLRASHEVEAITLVCSHYFAQVDKVTTFREVMARLGELARIIVTRCHAKVICLPTASGDSYTIEGSANLRSSDNTEQVLITNCPDTLRFHRDWMEELAESHAG